MYECTSLLVRVAWLACLAACFLPGQAHAQRILVTHPPLPNAILSASGRYIAAVVDNRFVVEDVDEQPDVYRYSLDGNSWARVPHRALIGSVDPAMVSGSFIELLSISDDGRYVGYVVHRRPPAPFAAAPPSVLSRYDLLTGTRNVIRDATFDPFAQPVMSRDGSTFAWVGASNTVLVGTVGQVPIAVGQACASSEPRCPAGVALTAAGQRVLYATVSNGAAVLETFERGTNARRRYESFSFAPAARLVTSATGEHVLATPGIEGGSMVLDVSVGRVETIAEQRVDRPVITDDGVYLLGIGGGIYDRRLTSELSLLPPSAFPGGPNYVCCARGLSADGRIGLASKVDYSTVLVDLDGDADGLFDPWEGTFGLDPTDAVDASQDPDGDGVINRDEARLRSHPRGVYRRIFAEGVSSPGFDTRTHVFQPPSAFSGPYRAGGVLVSFLGDNGQRVSRWRPRLSDDPQAYSPPISLGTSQYATIVESEAPVAAERITTWGGARPLGGHGSSGATPGLEWYFAEGATTGTFQLFYMFANPNESDALLDVEYLLAAGGSEMRQYVVPARSRRTIWVNQEGGALTAAEVSARIVASLPIVAERTMYLGGASGFTAGTASMGVPAAATTWWFAEGATGPVFDTFLLLANPTDALATVAVSFRLPDGQPVQRSYLVPARTRRTVWVDQEGPALADTAFSTRVDSDVPVVAERAMWWRSASSVEWIEGHSEVGATRGATSWAVAEMPESAFLLIANAAAQPGLVAVTYYTETGGGAARRHYDLPANGRVTVWPTQDNPQLPPGRYRAEVMSLPVGGAQAVDITVERAAYDGQFRTGTVYLGTPIP